MKGVINISISDEIHIYIKASNLQGTMEGAVKRNDWNEILNETIMIGWSRIIITKKEYSIDNSMLKIKMKMFKDTGMYNFDLELKNNGDNTYSAKLGRPDLFTWQGIILNLILTPFVLIYHITLFKILK